jgi:hypothetical protein
MNGECPFSERLAFSYHVFLFSLVSGATIRPYTGTITVPFIKLHIYVKIKEEGSKDKGIKSRKVTSKTYISEKKEEDTYRRSSVDINKLYIQIKVNNISKMQ